MRKEIQVLPIVLLTNAIQCVNVSVNVVIAFFRAALIKTLCTLQNNWYFNFQPLASTILVILWNCRLSISSESSSRTWISFHKQFPRRTYVALGGSSRMAYILAKATFLSLDPPVKIPKLTFLTLLGGFGWILGPIEVLLVARCAFVHLVVAADRDEWCQRRWSQH